MNWRRESAKIINKIIVSNPDLNLKELRKLISDAYPFGMRAYHPYKIWISEVRDQLKAHRKTEINNPEWTYGHSANQLFSDDLNPKEKQ
jgi:hypothetical protein